MKSFPLRMILVGALLIGGVVSCREEGPAERAGRAVDEAAEDVREGSEDAAEEIREGAERLGDEISGER